MSNPYDIFGTGSGSLLEALSASVTLSTSERFTKLLSNLALTDGQKEDARTKRENVTQCLNQAYYDSSSGVTNGCDRQIMLTIC